VLLGTALCLGFRGEAVVEEGAVPPPAQDAKRQEPPRPSGSRELYAETPASRAVDRGLLFLESHQEPDGSWISGIGKSTGIVSLVTMAFMSRGHVPGRGKYGDTLNRAIVWVIQQSRDGLILRDTSHGPMYCHGMSTLMLGEALGMVDETEKGFQTMAKVHQSAVNVILRAQAVSKEPSAQGGWRYNANSNDSDISVSGWMILALRAAQGIGSPVPKRSIDQAVAYIKRCAYPLGGFSYQPGGDPNLARTGTGVLALQLAGEFNSPEALRGGDYVRKNPLQWQGPFFFYTVYYCSQGMYQLGGAYWQEWRARAEEILLAHQNSDGSWPAPPNETHEHQAGPAYTTSMAILALSVEFRYLPIYQR
jgi:hypothetical protein